MVCNETLYLRRKHSFKLWVLDRETLRDVGEIMLQASLSDGVLFSDGRVLHHASLDDQWNLSVSKCIATWRRSGVFQILPLDDAFSPAVAHRQRLSSRLVETAYTTFGETGPAVDALIRSIPPSLRGCLTGIIANKQMSFSEFRGPSARW